MSEPFTPQPVAGRSRRAEDLDRNLALELVRVTEAAAMSAGRWVGRGDKEGGDGGRHAPADQLHPDARRGRHR